MAEESGIDATAQPLGKAAYSLFVSDQLCFRRGDVVYLVFNAIEPEVYGVESF